MKNQVLNLVLAFAAFAAVAGGKDDSGNDLTRQTLFGRIDGDQTTVGDLADFTDVSQVVIRTNANSVTSSFALGEADADPFLYYSQLYGNWYFDAVAASTYCLRTVGSAVYSNTAMNAEGIYDFGTNLTTKLDNKADGSLYDESLKINWKFVTYDGNLYYVATTNAEEEVTE